MAGCGVGNRLLLLPVPPGPHHDLTAINEFLAHLESIGIGEASALASIRTVKDTLTSPESGSLPADAARAAVHQFLDAVGQVPEAVRMASSAEDFMWFRFGQLLYEVAVQALVENHEAPNATPTAYVAALESLSKTVQLPDEVIGQMNAFFLKARVTKTTQELYEDAGALARTFYLLM